MARPRRAWLCLALSPLAAGCQALWGVDDIRDEGPGGAAGAAGGSAAPGSAGAGGARALSEAAAFRTFGESWSRFRAFDECRAGGAP